MAFHFHFIPDGRVVVVVVVMISRIYISIYGSLALSPVCMGRAYKKIHSKALFN
jgi:hypothetical protein